MDCGKKCARCELLKSHTAFYKYSKTLDGLQSWCIECIRVYMNEKREIYNLKERLRKNRSRTTGHTVDVYCQKFGALNFLGV